MGRLPNISTLIAAMGLLGTHAFGACVPDASATTPTAPVEGVWINPRGSVAVETRLCGAMLCGRIRWASAEAVQDAANSGIRDLVGTELLQDFRPSASGGWAGRLFVPDIGRSVQSTIVATGAGAMRVSGCVLDGLICRSQLWHRDARDAGARP